MRIGILGGTFDPPHIAHLILAEQAREQLALEKVLFMPAGDPWRKAGRDVSRSSLRREMTRLAIRGVEGFELDDREIHRQGETYTIDTLRELRAELHSEAELFLLLGQDALVDLPHWHEPAAIADYAVIVVAPREGVGVPETLPLDPMRVERIEMPYVDVSSTDLRARVRLGRSIRFLVRDAVSTFIEQNGLYVE
jgi:nicotinate-nucleotide adenylyltransferase